MGNDVRFDCCDKRTRWRLNAVRHRNPSVRHGRVTLSFGFGQNGEMSEAGGCELKTARPQWTSLAIQVLPVVAGVLAIVTRRLIMTGGDSWGAFFTLFGFQLGVALPLLAAHLAAYRLRAAIAGLLWLLAFGLYPLLLPLPGVSEGYFVAGDWVMMAIFSACGLLLRQRKDGRFIDVLQRLPLTLDTAVTAVLGLWVLAATSLFISTPDPVNNQPLDIWFDGARIAENPVLFLSYLLQFSFVAFLLFAYYWLCRHLLVHHLLRENGWIAFLSASIAFLAVAPPLMGSLVIALPLNEPHWTILPSETANAFAFTNYAFAFAMWVIICPIVMVSERLLQERSEAMNRHEQVRAELLHLQHQINPHFLFNTLNTLYALCLRDRVASAQAVVKLSDLLRYSVYEGQEDWVPLDAEITHLDNYLDLQNLRFGQRCEILAHWPRDADQYHIPPQMLLILVENAFKHGIELSDRPSRIIIQLVIADRRICFTCVNSPVSDRSDGQSAGVGLTNLRRRLELLCGEDFVLKSERQGDSWHAELELEPRLC